MLPHRSHPPSLGLADLRTLPMVGEEGSDCSGIVGEVGSMKKERFEYSLASTPDFLAVFDTRFEAVYPSSSHTNRRYCLCRYL